MNIKEKTQLRGFDNIKMPELHGHVKLTLKNVHNGKTEVIEGDNIVTDAVKDIMKANYLGGIDYSKMFPLWQKWFGGVLCFGSAFAIPQGETDPDPADYYPTSDNALIAHAGQTAIDVDHDDDMKRGNPLTSSYVSTASSMKVVFEWGTTHGNGTIRSIALTHSDTGSYGLGSNTYNFKNDFEPLEKLNVSSSFWNQLTVENDDVKNVQIMYDETHGLSFTNEGGLYQATDFLFKVKKLAYTKSGLFQTLSATDELDREFYVTVPITIWNKPCYYFDYENKYLWLFYNLKTDTTLDIDPETGNSIITYCIIDCENEQLVNLGTEQDPVYKKTIYSDAGDIAPLGVQQDYVNILKVGNYFYFPTSSNPTWHIYNGVNVNGLKKINITNTSDQTPVSFNETQKFYQSFMGKSDIFVNSGRVINGTTGYTCKPTLETVDNQLHNHLFSSPDRPSTYAQPEKIGTSVTSITKPQFILANKLILATKYNLAGAITKSTSQSMTLEYTLTET